MHQVVILTVPSIKLKQPSIIPIKIYNKLEGKPSKKETAYFRISEVGGYLFQNLISFSIRIDIRMGVQNRYHGIVIS